MQDDIGAKLTHGYTKRVFLRACGESWEHVLQNKVAYIGFSVGTWFITTLTTCYVDGRDKMIEDARDGLIGAAGVVVTLATVFMAKFLWFTPRRMCLEEEARANAAEATPAGVDKQAALVALRKLKGDAELLIERCFADDQKTTDESIQWERDVMAILTRNFPGMEADFESYLDLPKMPYNPDHPLMLPPYGERYQVMLETWRHLCQLDKIINKLAERLHA